MRVIITGSRYLPVFDIDSAVKASGFEITEVVSGHNSTGIDFLGECWAQAHGVPVKLLPVPWANYGDKAEGIRNEQATRYAAAVLAIWDGRSNRCITWNLIRAAMTWRLKIYIVLACNPEVVQQILDDFESQGWERTPEGIKNWKGQLNGS